MARPLTRPGEGRHRVVEAALRLFAERGVSGTSLSTIAEHLGVTKAAVYHHFRTKEEIVHAVLSPVLTQMTAFVAVAESETSAAGRRDRAVAGMVELVVEYASVTAIFRHDPEAARVVEADPSWVAVVARLRLLLLGPRPQPAARVAMALVGTGVLGAAGDPALSDLDAETVRTFLLTTARAALADVPV